MCLTTYLNLEPCSCSLVMTIYCGRNLIRFKLSSEVLRSLPYSYLLFLFCCLQMMWTYVSCGFVQYPCGAGPLLWLLELWLNFFEVFSTFVILRQSITRFNCILLGNLLPCILVSFLVHFLKYKLWKINVQNIDLKCFCPFLSNALQVRHKFKDS